MSQVETLDRNRPASAEPTREDTIKQVMDWCQAQEAVVLQNPGREVTLVIERHYWGESTILCPEINLRGPYVGEAIRQYVNAVTHGRYSHGSLLDLLDAQPFQIQDNFLARQVRVDTHTHQLKFGAREHLDSDGELLGLEYFLSSPRPQFNPLSLLKRKRDLSSAVPLSMTGSFW